MVDKLTVVANNADFASQHVKGRVAVFMGATAGIGENTLQRLITMLDASTFYILGRNPTAFASKLEELKKLAAPRDNKVVFIQTQVALISDVDKACEQIIAVEKKVDYLCLSAGGVPFGGAIYTEEGLETCFAVSYYSRLRMVQNLLPLLRQSSQPRVLSILNGTQEKSVNEEDLGLEKNWSITGVVNHTTTFTSLAFDLLAKNDNDGKIVFLHDSPGLVYTNSVGKSRPSRDDGLIYWAIVSVGQVVFNRLIYYFGTTVSESGERHAYLLTSQDYKPGSWQVDQRGKAQPPNKMLRGYQAKGLADVVWDHTLRVWDKALASTRQV
ncbi:hypothetical protein GGS20DRAFT_569129 [Poronia punctata]|nr:hypothetical protein GGS20DRAFT_569129 [Poronia punctata]